MQVAGGTTGLNGEMIDFIISFFLLGPNINRQLQIIMIQQTIIAA